MLSGDANKLIQWIYNDHGPLLEMNYNYAHNLQGMAWNCNHYKYNHNNLRQCKCNHNQNNDNCSIHNAFTSNSNSSNAFSHNHCSSHDEANPVHKTGPQQEGTASVVDPTQQNSRLCQQPTYSLGVRRINTTTDPCPVV